MIDYTDSLAGVTAVDLTGFFRGWKAPHSPEAHLRILEGSSHFILARESEGGRVVGFVTAITDGVQAGFIPLLEVLPECRGQGIGTELVKRMLAKLEGVPAIDLTCDPPLQKFYARLGMIPSVGMVVRNY